ncbi:APC membrane recruitment protein 2 [Gadus chalcogrammus]|uniref:APC membrane recruitment protein 2 n=1 Tax=Gadus chalcogrammus TaxID=1042646 RepID=UPI0024C49507|nr:APC membrane recruitment protein 2 [Gadus chalcogrammus]
MEVQSECGEPPADPQPTGKINKAAFKLFGKRRTGSGMAGFFSFRNKGAVSNGNPSSSENGHGSTAATAAAAAAEPAAPVELVRSKTHDGLPTGKSFSFFSFLRRGSLRTAESGGAGLARRGRGLKGLFSSMRWRRSRDRTSEADGGGGAGAAAAADEAREVEVAQVDITLTLEPLPHRPLEDASDPEPCAHHQTHDSSPGSVSPQFAASADDAGADSSSPAFPYTPTDSPLHEPRGPEARAGSGGAASLATPQPERRCGAVAADPPSEPSVDRLCSLLFTDVTSLKSFDSLTGCGDIIADTEEEVLSGANGGSGTSSSSSGGGGNGNGNGNGASAEEGATGRRTAPTSQGSPARRPLPSSQLTRSAFSSIASSPPPSLPSRAQVSPPQPEHVTGSGVVAYMGGGEEMASPEGVDDADMQGLWHMLPSTGDNSPALLRPHQGATTARKTPQVKTLGLSKIPVVGAAGSRGTAKPPPPAAHHHTYGARQPTSPGEKELLSDEGYWDTPTATPTATPVDEGIQRSERIILSRDSCSGDNLYDLYNDPEEEDKEDDLSSTPSPSTEYKLSPSSQTTPPSSSSSPPSFRSLKGSTSLPRDSKIPLSVRQSPPPPHSVSQSSLPSVLEASAAQPKTQAPPPARTRIPVSKVPVRRSGQNKPGNASRGTAHRK